MRQYRIALEGSDAISLSGYGVLLMFLAASIVSAVVGDSDSGSSNALLMLLAYLTTLVVHEGVHGFFFWVFGGKPTFGVGRVSFLPYMYAGAPGTSYSLSQMLVITLSPLILISIAAMAVAVSLAELARYMTVAFVGNFAGAVGDIWIASKLLSFRGSENLRIVDEKTGVSVHGEGEEFERTVETFSAAKENLVSRFVVSWVGASAAVALLTALLTALLLTTHDQMEILIGPRALPLIEFSQAPSGAYTVGFSLLPAIVAGFIYAAIYTSLRYARNRRISGMPQGSKGE